MSQTTGKRRRTNRACDVTCRVCGVTYDIRWVLRHESSQWHNLYLDKAGNLANTANNVPPVVSDDVDAQDVLSLMQNDEMLSIAADQTSSDSSQPRDTQMGGVEDESIDIDDIWGGVYGDAFVDGQEGVALDEEVVMVDEPAMSNEAVLADWEKLEQYRSEFASVHDESGRNSLLMPLVRAFLLDHVSLRAIGNLLPFVAGVDDSVPKSTKTFMTLVMKWLFPLRVAQVKCMTKAGALYHEEVQRAASSIRSEGVLLNRKKVLQSKYAHNEASVVMEKVVSHVPLPVAVAMLYLQAEEDGSLLRTVDDAANASRQHPHSAIMEKHPMTGFLYRWLVAQHGDAICGIDLFFDALAVSERSSQAKSPVNCQVRLVNRRLDVRHQWFTFALVPEDVHFDSFLQHCVVEPLRQMGDAGLVLRGPLGLGATDAERRVVKFFVLQFPGDLQQQFKDSGLLGSASTYGRCISCEADVDEIGIVGCVGPARDYDWCDLLNSAVRDDIEERANLTQFDGVRGAEPALRKLPGMDRFNFFQRFPADIMHSVLKGSLLKLLQYLPLLLPDDQRAAKSAPSLFAASANRRLRAVSDAFTTKGFQLPKMLYKCKKTNRVETVTLSFGDLHAIMSVIHLLVVEHARVTDVMQLVVEAQQFYFSLFGIGVYDIVEKWRSNAAVRASAKVAMNELVKRLGESTEIVVSENDIVEYLEALAVVKKYWKFRQRFQTTFASIEGSKGFRQPKMHAPEHIAHVVMLLGSLHVNSTLLNEASHIGVRLQLRTACARTVLYSMLRNLTLSRQLARHDMMAKRGRPPALARVRLLDARTVDGSMTTKEADVIAVCHQHIFAGAYYLWESSAVTRCLVRVVKAREEVIDGQQRFSVHVVTHKSCAPPPELQNMPMHCMQENGETWIQVGKDIDPRRRRCLQRTLVHDDSLLRNGARTAPYALFGSGVSGSRCVYANKYAAHCNIFIFSTLYDE